MRRKEENGNNMKKGTEESNVNESNETNLILRFNKMQISNSNINHSDYKLIFLN